LERKEEDGLSALEYSLLIKKRGLWSPTLRKAGRYFFIKKHSKV